MKRLELFDLYHPLQKMFYKRNCLKFDLNTVIPVNLSISSQLLIDYCLVIKMPMQYNV